MNEQSQQQWQEKLQETAVSFSYPPTPDIAGAVHGRLLSELSRPNPVQRRLAWELIIILLLMGGLMAVPQVRAAVLRVIRAGAITIFTSEIEETAVPSASVTPDVETAVSDQTPPLAIPDFADPITWAEAEASTTFPLGLPTYPKNLGSPDKVYLHTNGQPTTVMLVWLEPEQPDQVRMSLYHIEADQFARKRAIKIVETTKVNGREAFWIEGAHYFQLSNGRLQPWQFVEGNVLIWWTANNVTYRLESNLPLEEAVRIAESLQ